MKYFRKQEYKLKVVYILSKNNNKSIKMHEQTEDIYTYIYNENIM